MRILTTAPRPPLPARAPQVNTLEDMRRFVMEHSDFNRAQGVVSKHVNVMSALSEQVALRRLMDVSTVRGAGRAPARREHAFVWT